MSEPTVWVSTTSHRSRDRLQRIVPDLGREFGVWPEGGWPRGAYYEVPASHAEALSAVKGLRVLRGQPAGGRLFPRMTSAEMGGPQRGAWPVPEGEKR